MLAFGEDGLAAHSDHIYRDLPNMETMEDAIFRKMILTFCKSHGVLENVFGALGRNQSKLDGDTFIKLFTDQAIVQTLVNMRLRGVFVTQRPGVLVTGKQQKTVEITDVFTPNMEMSMQICGKDASGNDIFKLPELLRQALITGTFARQGDNLLFQTENLGCEGARHQLLIRRDIASTFIKIYTSCINELAANRAWQPLELKKYDNLSSFQSIQLRENYPVNCEVRRQAFIFGIGGSAWKVLDKPEDDVPHPDMTNFIYNEFNATLLWVQLPKP